MIRKIVYIGYQPLTVKVKEDFFMIDFIHDGYNVQYWDLTNIYFPKIKLKDSIGGELITKVNKICHFEQLLKENKKEDILYFVNFSFEWLVVDVFRLLTKYEAKTGIIARGMLPLPSLSYNLSVKSILSKLKFRKVIKFLQNRVAISLKSSGLIKPFDVMFYAGNESLKIAGLRYDLDVESAKLISINSSDYDRRLNSKSNTLEFKGRYAVFLDDYLPFHPDFQMLGINTLESSKYYDSLNSFFSKIEKEYDLKIIVAAHPKAELYRNNDFFDGRELHFEKTIELVKKSDFVIAHLSTSIGYAVMYDKKIILAYTDGLYKSMWTYFNIIKYFSETLNTPLININSYSIDEIITEIDREKYNDFVYTYMTSKENENIDSYSLIKRYLSERNPF